MAANIGGGATGGTSVEKRRVVAIYVATWAVVCAQLCCTQWPVIAPSVPAWGAQCACQGEDVGKGDVVECDYAHEPRWSEGDVRAGRVPDDVDGERVPGVPDVPASKLSLGCR